MADTAAATPDLVGLTRSLQAVAPPALLLPPRLLRRVIKQDRDVAGLGLQVPHRGSYVIARDDLLRIVDRDELGLPPDHPLADALILLPCPDAWDLASTPAPAILLRYWRLLFHAYVHVALEQRVHDGALDDAGIRARVQVIGATAFEEIRTVLKQEEFLLPPGDDRSVYMEFVALYLELHYFAGQLVSVYFPALGPPERIDRLLAGDVDSGRLFTATRPEGAADPVVPDRLTDDEAEVPPPAVDETPDTGLPAYRLFKRMKRRAKKAAGLGNVVRAALCRTRAAEVGPHARRAEMRTAARADLEQLAVRLQAAIGLDTQTPTQWRKALAPLLKPAARGFWPPEARLLYDLQKVCIDHEQELYAVDLVVWALSLGRRPLKRPVPRQRQVLLLRHLRSAGRRLKAIRVSDADRLRLVGLFRDAVRHVEGRLRADFQPLIHDTLVGEGMRPQNLPEQVALHKVIEELLDRAIERGFLTMGDFRDALSRNSLKFPDLAGPREFFRGDRLIRSNRRLALLLDGVYRRGEIYLRWLQRLSSAAFGTPLGRSLILYAVLPFGGAFFLLMGSIILPEEVMKLVHWVTGQAGEHPGGEHHHTPRPPLWAVVALGAFLFALLHAPWFRRLVAQALWLVYRGLRGLLIDLPRFMVGLPAVRAVLDSRPVRWLGRYALKPLLVTAAAGAVSWALGADGGTTALVSGAAFLSAVVFLNTRLGRDLEETVVDWLVRTWQRLHVDLLPGLFRLVMAAFRRVLEAVDRLLYRVDEWLRFRKSDAPLAMIWKPVVGLVWFGVAYLVRIYFNLFLEPTVNPIKHFPVVTVAAKIIFPFSIQLVHTLTPSLQPFLGRYLADGVGWLTVFSLPGVFGFLVWELKENWRLYEANRPATLQPDIIGHHGETMVRLLRPGLHAGTIPKLYARLRRAERAALRTGNRTAARKHREALHHTTESVRRWADRELVYLLNQGPPVGSVRLAVGNVCLATNQVRVEVCCPEPGTAGLEVVFEEHAGWLVAGVVQAGWLPQLAPERWQAGVTALAGLYKMAGVELVREQIAAKLGEAQAAYTITAEGILVPDDAGTAGWYPLRQGPERLPSAAGQLLFKSVPITWAEWVAYWDGQAAIKLPPTLVEGMCRLGRHLGEGRSART